MNKREGPFLIIVYLSIIMLKLFENKEIGHGDIDTLFCRNGFVGIGPSFPWIFSDSVCNL